MLSFLTVDWRTWAAWTGFGGQGTFGKNLTIYYFISQNSEKKKNHKESSISIKTGLDVWNQFYTFNIPLGKYWTTPRKFVDPL